MPNTQFLETFPLYKKFPYKFDGYIQQIPKAPIHMYCRTCHSEQTYIMNNEYIELYNRDLAEPDGKIFRLRYFCSACEHDLREFLIKFSGDYIIKVGQEPPWEISVDKALLKVMGDYSDYYKKGLVCESQGYGIGAYAYYRRIVEGIMDELLDSITSLIDPKELGVYKLALEKTKETKVAQEKIELVKDLLPASLRPDGMNPLGLLHDKLSEGLHAESDETCLEIAGGLRDILKFLSNEIIRHRESQKQFTESMRKVLEKKKN
jgi:hypothetical protein